MKFCFIIVTALCITLCAGCDDIDCDPTRIPFNGACWFLLGANYPAIEYGHDFGTTAWGHNGVSAELAGRWRVSTDAKSLGVTKVLRSSERAYSGNNSLKLIANLSGTSDSRKNAEVFIDLRYHAPSGVSSPANLLGVTLSCRVYAPDGSLGNPSNPNGLQLFVKDSSWLGQYGTWTNIREGEWNDVSLTPGDATPPGGETQPGFDPTKIVLVGLKIGTGNGSSATFDGSFHMDDFRAKGVTWFDFENPSVAQRDFATMRAAGVNVTRWFMFADCRAAPEFDANGNPTEVDQHFYDDIDAALEAAAENGVYVMFTLFDFLLCGSPTFENGVQMGGRADLITNPVKRQAFIDIVLKPLLARYGSHPNIIAWDVMNEPEWAMKIAGGGDQGQSVSATAMQDFVRVMAQVIRENTADQLVTLGSASSKWLSLWYECGLDFYQYHYYDSMTTSSPLGTLYADLGIPDGKPCILGEFPTKKTVTSFDTYLNTALNNDLAGALSWSFRAGDDFSAFSSSKLSSWVQAHPDLPINISGR